jgi:hypothetical protein
MGEILPFRKQALPERKGEPRCGEAAQILFFMGVRYKRLDDPAKTPTGAPDERGGGRKRKRRARA